VFVFNNKSIIAVSDINHYKDNFYCYIEIQWLDKDNESIISDILEQKKKREDYYILRRSKK
jgi:hypothetical protein